MPKEFLIDLLLALFNAITTFITADYFFSLFSNRNYKHKLLIAISFMFFCISPLVFDMSGINMIVLCVCTFAFAFAFDFKFYNKLIFTLLFIVFNALAELLVSSFFRVAFNIDANMVYGSNLIFVLGAVLSKIVCMLLCYVVSFLKNNVLTGKFRIRWVALCFLPIATIFVIYATYLSSFYTGENYKIAVISSVGLFLLTISNFMIFRLINSIHDTAVNEERLKMAEELVKQQEKQYQLIFESNEQVSKQRHDYKNFLYGLLAETKGGNVESIERRLNDELKKIGSKAEFTTGNSVIDTFLGYKKAEASAKGIDIEFEHRNASSVKISGVDLALVLGNAIDNAMDGCEELSDKDKKKIKIIVVVKDERLLITVSNFVAKNRNVDNLASTKKDANLHGFGVMNMKSVAAKYNGEVVFECKDNVFKTIIMVENQ